MVIKQRFEFFLFVQPKIGDLVDCPRCKQARPIVAIPCGDNPELGLLVIDCDDHIGIISWMQTRDVV